MLANDMYFSFADSTSRIIVGLPSQTSSTTSQLGAKVTASSPRYKISPEVLAIYSEAIHRHTDSMLKFQTFRTILEWISAKLDDHEFDPSHFEEFRRSAPIEGKIMIHVRLESCVNERLTSMRMKLEENCGFHVPDRTAMAYFVQIGLEKNLY